LIGQAALPHCMGCAVCHSVDGSKKVGPTWLHLYSSSVPCRMAQKWNADATYLTKFH